jgi:hypothetical protein
VVILVVKITIQLTCGIHGFKKKKHTTTRLFNKMAMQVPQESAEKKSTYLLLFIMSPPLGDEGIQFYRPFVKKWFLCNNKNTAT